MLGKHSELRPQALHRVLWLAFRGVADVMSDSLSELQPSEMQL